MDRALFNEIAKEVPKMNPLICKGIAVEQVKLAEKYLDKVFIAASASFPPGFTYEGPSPCTPREQFVEETRERYSKQTFELARNDFYMVKYHFKFNGEEIPPRYIYIPYLEKAGLMTIRGSQFVVNPVLADRLFSVDHERIFMPITRDKLIFERLTHPFVKRHAVEGGTTTTRISPSVAWGSIHSLAKKNSPYRTASGMTIKARTTLPHYLFAKYGVTESFKVYANCDIKIGNVREMTEALYPPSDWIVAYSTGLKPQGIRRGVYNPNDLAVAVPKKQYSSLVESMLGGLFYVADHFTDRVRTEWLDEISMWRIVLGYIIYRNGESEAKLLTDIDLHISSLDEYIDILILEELEAENIPCKDMYDLSAYITEHMTDMIINSDVASMYNKRLTVLRYIMLDAVKGIFNMTFALRRKAKGPKELTKNDIKKAMDKNLKSIVILKELTRTGHGEVNTMAYPGDNMIPKITSRIIQQSSATGNSGQAGLLKDPSKHLHRSLAEVGSYLNQPKFDPTGQSRINPYLTVDRYGYVQKNPEHEEVLSRLEESIRR